jgi:bacteriophage CI repressor helix-turn-helix domain
MPMLRNIEAERIRNGFTKDKLAKKLGVSTKSYYNWIYEKTDIPSSILMELAKIFGTSVGYLLSGSISGYTEKGGEKTDV